MFKVGDRVRIRDWDDMKREYGTDSDGDIKVPDIVFTRCMRHLCGRYATIRSISSQDDIIGLENWSDTSGDITWFFTKSMLEPAEENTLKQTSITIDKYGMNISSHDGIIWLKENEEKGEKKDMNKLLELYCEKAERTIENDYDEMIEEERNENPFVKEYNELINEFEAKMDDLYKREMDENGNHHVFANGCHPTFYQFDIDYDFTNENIEHYEECKKAELQDLEEFKQEVSAKLSLSDDLDYTLKVLKEYGIINKKTGKLESYFTELDEQNEV